MPIMLDPQSIRREKEISFINHFLKDDLQLGTRAQPSKRPTVRRNGFSIQSWLLWRLMQEDYII